MKTKKEINVQVDSTQKSDKERIKELEAENARLKYEISFYDDVMNEMREIVKANRAVKKAQILIRRCNTVSGRLSGVLRRTG